MVSGEEIQMQLWKDFAGPFEEKPTHSFGSGVEGSLNPELTLLTSLLPRPGHRQQSGGRTCVELFRHKAPLNTWPSFLFCGEGIVSCVLAAPSPLSWVSQNCPALFPKGLVQSEW